MDIEPVASASSYPNDANNALNYSTDKWYYTGGVSTPQWWMVDFKAAVMISRYQIMTFTGCHYINTWSIETSLDGETWDEVDSITRTTYPQEEVFTLKAPVKARYFKINGYSMGCSCQNCFVFWYVKFFGKKQAKCTQNTKLRQNMNRIDLLDGLSI